MQSDTHTPRFLAVFLSLALILTLVPIPGSAPALAAGKVIYVDVAGSDAYPGTPSQPLRTVQGGVDLAQAGDTVLVRPGTYDERVQVTKSGAAGSLIQIKSDQLHGANVRHGFRVAGDYNVIDGFEISPVSQETELGLTIYDAIRVNSSNNRFLNNYIHHTADYTGPTTTRKRNGIQLYPGANNNVLDGNTFDHTGLDGITISHTTNGNTVTNNTIFWAGWDPNATNYSDSYGTGIFANGTGHRIEDNEVQYPWKFGIHIGGNEQLVKNNVLKNIVQIGSMSTHKTSMWVDQGRYGALDNVVIDGNIFYASPEHIEVAPTDKDILGLHIRNNVFSEDAGYPTSIMLKATAAGATKRVYIYDNTFTGKGINLSDVGQNWAPGSIRVYNNIFMKGAMFTGGGSMSTYDHDYNLYLNSAAYAEGGLGELHGRTGDPFFVDAAALDFRLRPDSPAIDSGYSGLAPVADTNGNPRYDDPAVANVGGGSHAYYDIGAYEYQGGRPTDPPADTTEPQISGLTAVDVTMDSARIAWQTDEPADSQVEYGLDTSYAAATVDSNLKTGHSRTLTGLASGATYHYRVRSADAAGNVAVSGDRTFTTAETPPVDPPAPTDPEYIELEGEGAALTDPMVTGSDLEASGGGYLYSDLADGTGLADYTFSTTSSGQYWVWARVIAPTYSNDSFYLTVDSGPEDIWDVLVGASSSTWTWDRIRYRGTGPVDAPEFDPQNFNLEPGPHTLRVRAREPQTFLDKLVITNDPDYVPTDPPTPEPPADTTAPATLLTTVPSAPDGADGWFVSTPYITLTSDEPGSSYYQWDGGSWQTYANAVTAFDGEHTLYYYSVDSVGNAETPANELALKIDTVKPNGTVAIDDDATVTASTQVALSLNATDPDGSGISAMRFRNDNGTWSTWQSYAGTAAWTLASIDGPRTVYAEFKDAAGNVSAIASDDIVLDTAAPATSVSISPSAPDGADGWFVSTPSITLTSDESGSSYYQWDGGNWQTYANAVIAFDGEHTLYYYSVDSVGNQEVPRALVFKVDTSEPDPVPDPTPPPEPGDTEPPTGTVKIEGAAIYTQSAHVKLNLSANDGTGSGVAEMRLSNDGIFDDTAGLERWRPYVGTADWTLAGGDGQKHVHVQFKDADGNESDIYSDTIGLDGTDPEVTLSVPSYSTVKSKTTTFKISWAGTDPSPASGMDSYTVRYRPANSSTWADWKIGTTDTSAEFTGSAGRTYYFRVKADDKAGNSGWSTVKRTIVPYNEGSLIRRIRGFAGNFINSDSEFYLGSVKYSMKKGERVSYKFDGDHIALISTRAKSRGKAKIYIDGKHVKTIDTYAQKTGHHKVVFSRNFEKRGIHHIKIVNLGTPGHSRFDIDGLAVGR